MDENLLERWVNAVVDFNDGNDDYYRQFLTTDTAHSFAMTMPARNRPWPRIVYLLLRRGDRKGLIFFRGEDRLPVGLHADDHPVAFLGFVHQVLRERAEG